MSGNSSAGSNFKNPVINWIDYRLPIFTMMNKEYGRFPTPRNFNYFWNFGAIALVMLVTMILTGLFLAMNYTPHAALAFDSVERITRDVNFGWLLRALHANGASFFFVAVYIHMLRGLYYGSYKKPRELLWMMGVLIMLLMMATAFMGYVLPWGQMSFWGATVITNFFTAIPVVGESITHWLWGGFAVDNPTLNRFFALHFVLPFVIFAVVLLHVAALHIHGSNNPLGIDVKGPQDTLPFHPFYTLKDTFGTLVFLVIYCAFVFWMPDALGHPDNYIEANPLSTPAHIVPEWYFLPFYAILRAVTFDIGIPFTGIVLIEAKLGGVIAMFGAIAILFVLPWLDRHPLRSARFRPQFRAAFFLLVLAIVALTMVGANLPDAQVNLFGLHLPFTYLTMGQAATLYYFAFFLVLLPFVLAYEKGKPVPASITEAVTSRKPLVYFSLATLMLLTPALAQANEGAASLPQQNWSHHGPFGTYDRAALRRGFQVYKEVCSACHSLRQLSYRNLDALGFTPDEIKAIAAEYMVTAAPDENGDVGERAALPSDRFKSPFANANAARAANGGALPPDLSLIVRAREGHEDYIMAILLGYKAVPDGFTLMPGMNYNTAFAGHQIAMAQPLTAGAVTYTDGTVNSLPQMAHDVTTFLAWASDPHMEDRKRTGIKVVLFLLVFAGVMYAAKRRTWSKVH
jgi:ubiquinol-cytochrome c reductase cytochrome b/c1 subunit